MEEMMNVSDYDYVEDIKGSELIIPFSDRPEVYLVPLVFAIVFIVGVLGNGALIVIFLRQSDVRNVPNTYIFSMAVADLLTIVASEPFFSTAVTIDSYPFSALICIVSESVKDISIGVSVFTLTALSADCFFSIVDPRGSRHTGDSRAMRFTIITAISIWVLALICAIPTMAFTQLQGFPLNAHFFYACRSNPIEWELYPKVNTINKFFVTYTIPLFIIAVFYGMLARHLTRSKHNVSGEMQRQIYARKKVAKLVLALVVIFAVCFFPHHVTMIYIHTFPNFHYYYNEYWHAFRITGFCLSFINSCTNPIALYCLSNEFRAHFNRYLLCCCCSREQETNVKWSRRRGPDELDTLIEEGGDSTLQPQVDLGIDGAIPTAQQDASESPTQGRR